MLNEAVLETVHEGVRTAWPPREIEHPVSSVVLTPFYRLLEGRRELPHCARDRTASSHVSHAAMLELLERGRRLTGDDAIGLHAAERIEPGDFGLLEFLMRSAPTLADAIEQTSKYLPLVIEGDCELVRSDRHALLRVSVADHLDAPPALYEFALATMYLLATRYAVGDGIQLSAVEFTHLPPRHLAEHERIFGLLPRFGCRHNTVSFASSALRLPLRTADAKLFAFLEHQAKETLAKLPRHRSLRMRVSDAVLELFDQGLPDRAAVARKLGMSESSLRRRLAEHGTSFSTVLDQLRRQEARRLLVDRELQVSEIAARLGFAFPSAFQRACRRWYGVAPGELR